MISFIICSIHPEKLKALKQNVIQTIGVEHEFIVIDNTTAHYPLGKAYNIGAQQAKYPYLCFAHEDIIFEGENWGAHLAEKLAEPQTGIIGFAGSIGKTATLSTLAIDREHSRCNFTEVVDNKSVRHLVNINQEFEQVITLDGLCLFMRKEVWLQTPFDCQTFDGFHLYDLDISIAVAKTHTNYVCKFPSVYHYSKGSFNKQWYKYALKFHSKWNDALPLYIDGITESHKLKLEKKVQRIMTYFLLKKSLLTPNAILPQIHLTRKNHPFRVSSYYMYYRYLRYLVEKKYLDN